MNLQTHIPRQTAGQVSNQAGTSLSVLPQENDNTQIQNFAGLRASSILEARRLVQAKIYEIIMQKQQPGRELPQRKIYDIVKRLEEALFKTATTKDEYMNLDTLEARLQFLVKRQPFGNQNQQFVRSSSSSSISTMIPTPGMPQNANSSSSATDNSHTGGAFSTGGGSLANGYQHPSSNFPSRNNLGVQRTTSQSQSQMIPTPGFSNSSNYNRTNNNNNNSNNNNINNTSNNNNNNNNNMGGGIRSGVQQKSHEFSNVQMLNGPGTSDGYVYGNSSQSVQRYDQNQGQMLHDSSGSGNIYGPTAPAGSVMNSQNLDGVNLQSIPKLNSSRINLQTARQTVNIKQEQSEKEIFQSSQFLQQPPAQQHHAFHSPQLISDPVSHSNHHHTKCEPGMERQAVGSTIQPFQSSEVPRHNNSIEDLSRNSMQDFIADDHNIQEEFRQRISGGDEAQQNNLSSESSLISQSVSTSKTASAINSNSAASRSHNLNREHQFKNQQRWLLFLRHARRCTAPEGKCPENNCVNAQKLLGHMEKCIVPECTYPRCLMTRVLVNHHKRCRDSTCPVCVPVRVFLKQLQTSASSSPCAVDGPSKPVDARSNPQSVVKTAEDLQPSLKRMKIEQLAGSVVPKCESSSINSSVPAADQLDEHQNDIKMTSDALTATAVPKKEFPDQVNRIDDLDSKPIKSSDGDYIMSSDPTSGIPKQENIKTENEQVQVKQENVASTSESVGVVTKSQKPKVKGVSLMELFTPEQIQEHIRGLRQWVGQSKAKAEKNQAMERSMTENSCQLCAVEKLSFEPPPLYCTCGARIKRNAMYYTIGAGETRHYFCIPCFNDVRGDTITVDRMTFKKAMVEKKKNDEETEEWWVQCDKCEAWQHQICALFNGKRNDGGSAEYTCPNCYIEEIERGERMPLPQTTVLGAKDLPKTILSDHIEQRLFKRLNQERAERARALGKKYDEVPGAEDLVLRVVSSVDKKLEVKPRFLEIFQEDNYPAEFAYKSKVVLLFQKIEGVEVCLFGMYVQEFGSECDHPNHRRVYLSYLDSVKYFRPEIRTVKGEALRTFVYHEILIGYLEYCKLRGFTSCYIWACPPLKGEDYILYCHPEIQKTPKSDKLREWYLEMLKKAAKENIVVELVNLYDHFFVSSGESKAKVSAARLPYFDGDYWPGAAEDIIYQIHQEDDGRKQPKKGTTKKLITKRSLKASGQTELTGNASKDLLLMHKLGETISSMKEDFIMVHLQHSCTHCCNLMVQGNRWVCNQCKKFQLCDKCYEAEQNLEEKDKHPVNHREKHVLHRVEIDSISEDTKDKDEILESEFFDTRQAFLSLCQGNHYQYDTLRRAKHSSMMVLYHLHNPTAPAFIISCNKCYIDIEAGQGWRCELCPDYDVCNTCYQNGEIDHPHKLTHHPSIAERDAQNTEARQQRVLQLRKMLDLLVHASQCRSPHCQYPHCRKVKGLFRHGIQCKIRASGGCLLCKKMWLLLQIHSRACKESRCNVPRCRDLKEHLRRLQQQADSRRRAAVMEMMRQRAAEVAGSSG
jgi:E1A/CREB-binding protein